MVKLGRTFNLQTVAEGIEQPEQAAQLQVIGADMGQGYWFSRPLTAPMMETFLTEAATRHQRRLRWWSCGPEIAGRPGGQPVDGGGRSRHRRISSCTASTFRVASTWWTTSLRSNSSMIGRVFSW